MKRLLTLIVVCFLIVGPGYSKSEPKTLPFEEVYNKQIQALSARKNQAITIEDFHEKYINGRSALQIEAQKDEWKKKNTWPVISFDMEIWGVDKAVSGTQLIKDNPDKFASINVKSDKDSDSYSSLKFYAYFYILKNDALKLNIGEYIKGYGALSDFRTSYDSFSCYLNFVIVEKDVEENTEQADSNISEDESTESNDVINEDNIVEGNE